MSHVYKAIDDVQYIYSSLNIECCYNPMLLIEKYSFIFGWRIRMTYFVGRPSLKVVDRGET